MLGQEYYNSQGELHNFESPTPPMGDEQVETAMEPAHAAILLHKKPDAYAELTQYKGGELTAERTGLQAGGKYILAVKENNFVIGYTLRDNHEVFDYLKVKYSGDKAA